MYGFSSTLQPFNNSESALVIGNPIQTWEDEQNRKVKCGSIGRTNRKSIIKYPKSAPWSQFNDTMKNVDKYSSYALTTGQFEGEGLVVSAPRDNGYKGSVYICKNCFKKNAETLQKVTGKEIGEHFGSSVAACDVTGDGDGHDDLIVGAPHYVENGNYWNTGRVHVFLWSKKLHQLEVAR